MGLRRMAAAGAVGAVAVAPAVLGGGLTVVVAAAAAGPGTGAGAGGSVAPAGPTDPAAEAIPPGMLVLYRNAAATCPGLPWEVLAGIGKVETDHGRAVRTSSAGAEGPMQFMPATWAAYGVDANGDGTADVQDPADAVYAAARLLCADGGGRPATLSSAVFAYNHSSGYVATVLAWAARYAG